jgi:hypothetical protein
MAKRLNKITPIATSVALSLGLTGCFGDDDKVTKVEPPVQVEGSVTIDFSTAVSGRAVKGTLKNASISVQTVDANGELVDIAYRTSQETVEKSAKGTSENAAKEAAIQAIKDSNPSLSTGEKGEYEIYLDSNFSGPVYITVAAKKEGDESLIKCDAFVGCGALDAESNLDVNNNNKIDFGEWYKDNLELSVVKLITKKSAESSSVKGLQFAEGDSQASFKANLTIFTSTAAAILIANANSGEINSEAISSASKSVIKALIGDEALVAALASDLSEGGAVDFTDIDGTESIDAGILTMIQVAASIQAVAAKGTNGSIADVIAKLKNDVKENTLEASDTFKELKSQSKTAGKILTAVVSGDTQAIKDALIEAGVDETTATQTATTAKEAKDKAVSSGATSEEDLKENAEESQKQLEEIGDGEALENAKLAELLSKQLVELKNELADVKITISSFQTQLNSVSTLGDDLSSNDKVLAYALAATELKDAVSASTVFSSIERLSTTASQLVSSSSDLTAKDAQYKSISDDAAAQKALIDAEDAKVNPLRTAVSSEFELAEKAVQDLGLQVEAAKTIAESAVAKAQASRLVAEQAELDFSVIKTRFDQLVSSINNADDAEKASNVLIEFQTAYSNNKTAAMAFSSDATSAKEKSDAYVLKAKSTDVESDSLSIQQLATEILSFANTHSEKVFSEARETEMTAGIAKVGSGKLVNVSFVTREGASAVYNTGDVIFDVVKNILNNTDFNKGKQSGISPRYPDWSYEYDTNEFTFSFVNTKDGQRVDALAGFVGSTKARVFITWSANLNSDSGQSVEITAPSLDVCETYSANDVAAFPENVDAFNASCLVLYLDGKANNFDDAADRKVERVKSFNQVKFTDNADAFDGFVAFELNGLDQQGNSAPLFEQGVVEFVDFIVTGETHKVQFTTKFAVKYDEQDNQIGQMSIDLHNFNGYRFDVNLVDEAGPLRGEVSLNNYSQTLSKVIAGQVEEITNGFRINYLDGSKIDYTNLEVYSDR